jgi:hypothetical protein
MPTPPRWFAGFSDDPEYSVTFKKGGEAFWQSNPGPQSWSLMCPYDEILLGGARGGGKSQALIAWMAMGNLSLAPEDPAHHSYLLDPSFRGLLLRDEYASMAEFVDEAMDLYRHFEGKPKDDPVVFTFKSGAKIYTNHLGNKEAYSKYKGWNLTKIGVEELTQIPEFSWYVKLFGSLRAKKQFRIYKGKTLPKLPTQIMNTTNPDGAGAAWVKERFVEVYAKGQLIPWNTPMLDPITGLKRIFIPAKLSDNQYLRDDTKYLGMLRSQDSVTQAQWIDGDWNAGSSTYFRDYRSDGPRGQEEIEKYPWARHRVAAPHPQLKPYWYRFGGVDWGYVHNSVFIKGCRNEADKRIHIYEELVIRQIGSYELGMMLAKWWLPELEQLPDHQVIISLSPDAFSKTDAGRTKAEQMEAGIKEAIGPYGALLMRYNDEEREAAMRNADYAARLFANRQQQVQGKMCIVLKPANNDRVGGWSYINELLRFRPVRTETEDQIRMRLQTLYARGGVEAYERELVETRKDSGPEILPRLLIWDNCREVDRCLKSAQRAEPPRGEDVRGWNAEEGKGGDDALDALRYSLMGFKEVEARIPKGYWVAERTSEIQQQHVTDFGEPITDPTRLAMIAMRQQAIYEKANGVTGGGTLNFARAGSMRHRTQ